LLDRPFLKYAPLVRYVQALAPNQVALSELTLVVRLSLVYHSAKRAGRDILAFKMLGSPFPAQKERTMISFQNPTQLPTVSNAMLAHPALTLVWLTKTQVFLVRLATTALLEHTIQLNSHAMQVTLQVSSHT
jgi:hypothetical protein